MKVRVLIAYDGSEAADYALDDLQRAGLGNDVEAIILSVAELWLPPPPVSAGVDEPFPRYTAPGLESGRVRATEIIEQVESQAKDASGRLQATFSSWNISTEAYTGSPAWEVLKKADEWNPDLIIVGSQGKSALSRFFLGSISQKILTEARCSVRVGRRPVPNHGSVRLLVGVDGSPGADEALHAVAKREWSAGAEVCVVAVEDPNIALAVGSLNAQMTQWIAESDTENDEWAERLVETSGTELRRAGLDVSTVVKIGDAKKVLVDEAKRQKADCIFVGATGFSNRLERFLLGSVSAAVANRAECTVEVVRSLQNAAH